MASTERLQMHNCLGPILASDLTAAELNRWRLDNAEQASPHWREHERRVRWAFLFYDPAVLEARPGCALQMGLFDSYDYPPLSAAEVWHPLGKE